MREIRIRRERDQQGRSRNLWVTRRQQWSLVWNVSKPDPDIRTTPKPAEERTWKQGAAKGKKRDRVTDATSASNDIYAQGIGVAKLRAFVGLRDADGPNCEFYYLAACARSVENAASA